MGNYKQLLLITLLTFVIFGCVKKRDLSRNQVIVHMSSNPDGLHATNDNSVNRTIIFYYTHKTLFKIHPKTLTLVPELAVAEPEVSENGLDYTIEIKEGVKWDDGSPLTVDDIIFTTKIVLAPLTGNSQIKGNYTSVIKNVRKHPTHPRKFIMTAWKKHVSNADIYTEVYIQQQKRLDPNGVLNNYTFEKIFDPNNEPTQEIVDWFNKYNDGDNGHNPDKLRGLGPYQVKEFVSNSYITLERKENWYGDKSDFIYDQNNPKKIIFKIITDDAAAYLAIKNEQLDAVYNIGTTKLIKLQKLDYFNEKYHSDFIDQYSYAYIGLNTKPDGIEYQPFFTDKNVRRAAAHLVPLEEIIDVIIQGKAIRQVANISPLKKSYNHDLPLIQYDLEKAKDLLKNAGWKDTDGDNVLDKEIDGKKLKFSFKLSYMSGSSSYKAMVLMIKESFYRAGIEVIPTPQDFTLFYKNAQEHKFDAMMGGWGAGSTYSDPTQLWHTSSWANKGSNFCGFGDAESDALIELANTSLDKEKHIEALHKLQKKLYDEQPYIFMYSVKRKVIAHKRFNNTDFYNEKPGMVFSNFTLNPTYIGGSLKPE